MKQLFSAIDIGTNSVRHALAELRNGNLVIVEKKLITSRLGEGTASTDELKKTAMVRTIDAVESFVSESQEKGSRLLGIYATSAVREASNQNAFLDMAKQRGIQIEVLSGETESTIAFRGVTENKCGLFAVADIGGGSTEISFGCDGVLKSAKSTRIGAVRMTQMFASEDGTVARDNQKALLNLAMDAFASISVDLPDNAMMYGVGGTFTTLAAMIMGMIEYDANMIQDAPVSLADVHALRIKLCSMTNEEKIGLPGLMPKRADIIACATLIAEAVMKTTKREFVRASEKDGLDGYMYYKLSLERGS